MARGLSPLQKDILRVLAKSPGASTAAEVMEGLDLDFSQGSNPRINANSLRRGLMRLWERGLVMRTAETLYLDGGRYSHFWALPTERAIDRHCQSDPPYLVSDRCPLHATYGNVVHGRWGPAKEKNRDAVSVMIDANPRIELTASSPVGKIKPAEREATRGGIFATDEDKAPASGSGNQIKPRISERFRDRLASGPLAQIKPAEREATRQDARQDGPGRLVGAFYGLEGGKAPNANTRTSGPENGSCGWWRLQVHKVKADC